MTEEPKPESPPMVNSEKKYANPRYLPRLTDEELAKLSRPSLIQLLWINRWLAVKWHRALIVWQSLCVLALGYSVVITYLWVRS